MKAGGTGVKLLVPDSRTARASDISDGNMTYWKITGEPVDINHSIKNTTYRSIVLLDLDIVFIET